MLTNTLHYLPIYHKLQAPYQETLGLDASSTQSSKQNHHGHNNVGKSGGDFAVESLEFESETVP